MTCRLQYGVHVYKRVYEELFRAANKIHESIVLLRDIYTWRGGVNQPFQFFLCIIFLFGFIIVIIWGIGGYTYSAIVIIVYSYHGTQNLIYIDYIEYGMHP